MPSSWKQPLSVLTNLAYLVAGWVILSYSTGPLDTFYGAMLGWLFVGSFAWHQSLNRTGNCLDRLAMYWVTPMAFALIMRKILGGGEAWAAADAYVIGGAVLVSLITSVFNQRISSKYILAPQAVLLLLALSAVSGLAAAVCATLLTVAYLLREAATVFEGGTYSYAGDALHAAWHVLTAWLYYAIWVVTAL